MISWGILFEFLHFPSNKQLHSVDWGGLSSHIMARLTTLPLNAIHSRGLSVWLTTTVLQVFLFFYSLHSLSKYQTTLTSSSLNVFYFSYYVSLQVYPLHG